MVERSGVDAAGRQGELLAEQGDREGALEDAVSAWRFSDALWFDPLGRRRAHLDSLSVEDRWEATGDDPEDWAYMECEQLVQLLAERGDDAAIAELRARAAAGDPPAAAKLAELD